MTTMDRVKYRINTFDSIRRLLQRSAGGKRDPIPDMSTHSGHGTYLGNNRVLVRVRVDRLYIAFILPADDLLITPWFIASGQYDNDVTRFLVGATRKETTFIDVGANFGFFTCLMARLCPDGKVIGIEADSRIHGILRDNIAANGLSDVALAVHAAAGNSDSPMTLFRRVTRPGNTSIVYMDEGFTESLGEPPVEKFEVATIRIDDVVRNFDLPVDIIKIDVEGAEPLVIQGASKTIQQNSSIRLILEWSPGQIQCAGFDVSLFADTLVGFGLKAYTLQGGEPAPISLSELKTLPYQSGVLFQR